MAVLLAVFGWTIIYFSAQYEARRLDAILEANKTSLNPQPVCLDCTPDSIGWADLGIGMFIVAGSLSIAGGRVWMQNRR
jgi:hypothetical protein